MWSDYLREEEGCETLETDYGFCSYTFSNEEFFCAHLYIKPEFRRRGKGVDFGVEIEKHAREIGAKVMTGNIWFNKKNKKRFVEKLRIFEAFGFTIDSVQENVVTVIKFLED